MTRTMHGSGIEELGCDRDRRGLYPSRCPNKALAKALAVCAAGWELTSKSTAGRKLLTQEGAPHRPETGFLAVTTSISTDPDKQRLQGCVLGDMKGADRLSGIARASKKPPYSYLDAYRRYKYLTYMLCYTTDPRRIRLGGGSLRNARGQPVPRNP
jgi:hypothetical protein